MKKPLLIIFTLLLLVTAVVSAPASVQAAGLSINSDSCILLDGETGQILYGKNPYTLYGDGSFNILLTIITALRFEDAPQELTVSESALEYCYDTPRLGLEAGETVTLSDMLNAIYLGGYVDACTVIAENLGVTLVDTTTTEYALLNDFNKAQTAIDAFIHQMNVTADELGCPTMGSTNPDQHFYDTQLCSCLDIATLIRSAVKNDEFKKIFATAEYTLNGDVDSVNDRQQDWKMKRNAALNAGTAVTETSEGAAEEATEETETSGDTTESSDSNDSNDSNDSETKSGTAATADSADSTKINLRSLNSLLNGDILYSGIQGGVFAFNSNIEKYHALAYAVKEDRQLIAVAMSGDEFKVYDDLQALLNFGFYKWETVTLEEETLYNYLPESISDRDIAFYGRRDILLPSDYDINHLEAAVSYTEKDYLSGAITVTLPESESYAGTVTTVYFYETNTNSKLLPILKIGGLVLLIVIALLLLNYFRRFFNKNPKGKAYQERIRKTAKKAKAQQAAERDNTTPKQQRYTLYTDPFPEETPVSDYRQQKNSEHNKTDNLKHFDKKRSQRQTRKKSSRNSKGRGNRE